MSTPTPYAYMAALLQDRLPDLLKTERGRRGMSQRAAARQIDVSFSTVSRIEAGRDCALSHAVAVLRWLDASP